MKEAVFQTGESVLRVEEHAQAISIRWGEGRTQQIVRLLEQMHDYFGNRRYIIYGRKGWANVLKNMGYTYRGRVGPRKYDHVIVREPHDVRPDKIVALAEQDSDFKDEAEDRLEELFGSIKAAGSHADLDAIDVTTGWP